MLDYSEPEVVLALKPFEEQKNFPPIEVWLGDLKTELEEMDLLNISIITVYGIPMYKQGLSDDIIKLIFDRLKILRKEAKVAKLKAKVKELETKIFEGE